MTSSPRVDVERAADDLMVLPFPQPGPPVLLAYHDLNLALNGTAQQKQDRQPFSDLPRPWDPPTCRDPDLRRGLWTWLDDVVTWLNHEYTWDTAGTIPSCWPQHPHLVHEIAVIADQRRRAGVAMTSDGLEEWHRYALPSFIDRLRQRIKDHCDDGHVNWPARGRYVRQISEAAGVARSGVYEVDVAARSAIVEEPGVEGGGNRRGGSSARYAILDRHTGEIADIEV